MTFYEEGRRADALAFSLATLGRIPSLRSALTATPGAPRGAQRSKKAK